MTSPGGSNEIRIVIRGDNEIRPGLANADRDIRHFQTQQVSGFRAWAQRLTRSGTEAGRELGQGLANGAQRGTDRLAEDMADNVRDLRTRLEREGERAGRDLAEGVEDGAESADLDGQLQDVGADGGGGLKAGLAAGAAGAVAALAAVGLAAGVAMAKAVQSAMAAEVDHDKLAAQLGLTERESHRAGALAGKVYAQAYGESLADVDDALKHVSLNISDLRKTSNADIESMTKKAMDLATAYEMDVGESTRAVGKMIKTGLVKDATEGFDLITAGVRAGADEAGDLLETFSEYSTQFRDVGLTGPKALGLMSQALKAGARDADTAADAIKEFAILSKDAGNKDVAAAYEALHLNADKMFKVFAKGGPDADKAMKLVIDRLRAMKSPVDQNATAVALFGTKAEDLQDALYAMDPTTAVAALGKIEGSAKQLGDTLGDNLTTKVESFKRRIELQFTEMGEGILGFFEDVSESDGAKKFMSVFREDIMPLLQGFGEWVGGTLGPMMKDGLVRWLDQGAEAMEDLGDMVQENRPELEQLVEVAKQIVEAFFRIATSKFATSGLKFAIGSVSLFIETLARMGPAIRRTIDAGSTMAMMFIGFFKKIIDAAAWAFGWVPGLGPKLRNAQKNFDAFANNAVRDLASIQNAARGIKSPNITVKVATAEAFARIRAVKSQLNSIQYANAGRYMAMATGGIVGAATGGIHGGMRWVGEHGPELVELPYGSKVNPAGQSARMAAASGGGGGVATIVVDLTGADRGLLEWLRRAARIEGGGNVQLAFGKGG